MDPSNKEVKCGVRKFTGYSSKILNTLCPEESDVDSSSGDSSVSDKLYVLWLFEAQDNEIIDKLHILHSAQKKER